MPTETTLRRQARALDAALQQQRQAHLADPLPTLAERKADLLQLRRFILDHQQAICDAISADYGHRSRHETMLMELMPVISDIQVSRMKHRATARKRILTITGENELPGGGAVTRGTSEIGEILSSYGRTGFALVRLDRLDETQGEITAAQIPVTLKRPAWLL